MWGGGGGRPPPPPTRGGGGGGGGQKDPEMQILPFGIAVPKRANLPETEPILGPFWVLENPLRGFGGPWALGMAHARLGQNVETRLSAVLGAFSANVYGNIKIANMAIADAVDRLGRLTETESRPFRYPNSVGFGLGGGHHDRAVSWATSPKSRFGGSCRVGPRDEMGGRWMPPGPAWWSAWSSSPPSAWRALGWSGAPIMGEGTLYSGGGGAVALARIGGSSSYKSPCSSCSSNRRRSSRFSEGEPPHPAPNNIWHWILLGCSDPLCH